MTRAGLSRAGGFFGVLALMPFITPQQWILNILIFTLMFAAMSSAWNLVGGFAGYPSLGHAAFFGIGAYTLGIWYHHHSMGNSYQPFLLLPLVGIIAAVIGWPIAAISMRTRADTFAIVTITLLFVGQTLAFNERSFTGGSQGLALPVPTFDVNTYERPFYYVLLILLALAMLITFGTMRSKIGLSLAAVRADEDKARGIGVRVNGVKFLAFSVSVGITAMVGAVWGYYVGFLYPQFSFDPLITIAIVLMTFLGGRGTLWGPVIGAFILESGQQYLAYRLGGSQFYLIAYALIFLCTMLLLPRGIVPTIQDKLRARRRRQALDADPVAASPSPVPSGVGPLGGKP